ncbi:hypothetical protein [Salibacterium sp. K-3]
MVTRTISIAAISDDDKARLAETLYDVWGVRKADIHPAQGEVLVSLDEDAGSWIDVEQAVRDSGLEVKGYRSPSDHETR